MIDALAYAPQPDSVVLLELPLIIGGARAEDGKYRTVSPTCT